AQEHLPGRTGERGIVQPDDQRDREFSVEGLGHRVTLEEPHRPSHAGNAADPRQVGVLKRLGLVPVFRLWIHHPDLGIGDSENLARGALHDPGEDRGLVFEEEGAERDCENEPEVFRPVADQHPKGHEVHPRALLLTSVLGGTKYPVKELFTRWYKKERSGAWVDRESTTPRLRSSTPPMRSGTPGFPAPRSTISPPKPR